MDTSRVEWSSLHDGTPRSLHNHMSFMPSSTISEVTLPPTCRFSLDKTGRWRPHYLIARCRPDGVKRTRTNRPRPTELQCFLQYIFPFLVEVLGPSYICRASSSSCRQRRGRCGRRWAPSPSFVTLTAMRLRPLGVLSLWRLLDIFGFGNSLAVLWLPWAALVWAFMLL